MKYLFAFACVLVFALYIDAQRQGCCLPDSYRVNMTLFSNGQPRRIPTWNLLFSTDSTVPITRIDYWGNYTGNGIEQITLWDIYEEVCILH